MGFFTHSWLGLVLFGLGKSFIKGFAISHLESDPSG